ncbi:MAG: neutral/alkaline non-lysosomal ceramidase N-terminal domain-containing protein [Chitinophagales bacterium]|nr:neutral/alkaline non-lysosomal ceramidase N-terminal domain-containing protein [Bacteroidota bacterium]MCB9227417.1 neutral/alkaline non-lysosomal ceramidase N-terminal domain-containing protein [Chitinophagales bacterium]
MLLGTGKADITAFKEGVGMLGYGQAFNIMENVATPLYARAFLFKTDEKLIAYINCELGFITPSLKRGVVKKLRRKHDKTEYNNNNILLAAQHTHSGPSGFSHHGLYNTNSPGFVLEIYNKIVDGIVEAILKAEENFEEVSVQYSEGEFEEEKEVGFQRSLKAYLKNPEAKKITKKELHLGINREMRLLKFVNEKNEIKGSINWFGTHPTSLPNTNTSVCSDNKGFAAQYLEDDLQKNKTDFLGIFAQGSCGDVSPRFQYNKKHSRIRGKLDGKFLNDDMKSAQYNGQLQYEKAKELITKENQTKIEVNELDYGLMYVDFSNIIIDEKFTGGIKNARTSPSCMGVAFLKGAPDGPGMLEPFAYITALLSRAVKAGEYVRALFMPKEWGMAMRQKYTSQGNKDIAIESGDRKIMATYDINNLILPAWVDETISNLKKFHRRGALDKNPWTPQILPLQIVKLGTIAICAFPFEITTIAAQRLQKTIEDILIGNGGYTKVILNPYSNAYNGYITTYEEYQVQCYEGGHTVFGEWSLAALQTEFEKLAKEMLKTEDERNLSHDVTPLVFTKEDLNKFSYFKGQYYLNTIKRKERLAKVKARRRNKLEKRKERIQKKLDDL